MDVLPDDMLFEILARAADDDLVDYYAITATCIRWRTLAHKRIIAPRIATVSRVPPPAGVHTVRHNLPQGTEVTHKRIIDRVEHIVLRADGLIYTTPGSYFVKNGRHEHHWKWPDGIKDITIHNPHNSICVPPEAEVVRVIASEPSKYIIFNVASLRKVILMNKASCSPVIRMYGWGFDIIRE